MRTTVLDKGSFFRSLADSIDSAEKFVFIESYIWIDDSVGRLIAECVLRAADRGVKVVIRDDISGSWFEHTPGRVPMLFDKDDVSFKLYSLKTGFLTLYNFDWVGFFVYGCRKRKRLGVNLLYRRLRSHVNVHIIKGPFFNHGKTVVVDGRVAFVGGQCISCDYEVWTDYNVRIEDAFTASGILSAVLGSGGHSGVVSFFTNSFGGVSLHKRQKDFIRGLKGELFVEMAYLGSGYLPVFAGLVNSGVDVFFLVSKRTDTNHDRNMLFLSELFRLTKGAKNLHVGVSDDMIHSKGVVCCDGLCLGSNNFSVSGYEFDLNEHNLFSSFPGLVESVLSRFKEDFCRSSKVCCAEELPKWSFLKSKRDEFAVFLFALFARLNKKRIDKARRNADRIARGILGHGY